MSSFQPPHDLGFDTADSSLPTADPGEETQTPVRSKPSLSACLPVSGEAVAETHGPGASDTAEVGGPATDSDETGRTADEVWREQAEFESAQRAEQAIEEAADQVCILPWCYLKLAHID